MFLYLFHRSDSSERTKHSKSFTVQSFHVFSKFKLLWSTSYFPVVKKVTGMTNSFSKCGCNINITHHSSIKFMLSDFQNISLLIKPLADLESHKKQTQQNKKPMSSLSLSEELQTAIFLFSLLFLYLSICQVVSREWYSLGGHGVLAVNPDSLLKWATLSTYLIALSLTFSIWKMNKWFLAL